MAECRRRALSQHTPVRPIDRSTPSSAAASASWALVHWPRGRHGR